jgi:nucleotide-binding universal stress UspA family protein
MFKPKNILVPTDFTENSAKAFDAAFGIAQKFGSNIHLFHAVNLVQQCSADYCIDIGLMERIESESVEKSKEALKKTTDKYRKSKGPKVFSNGRKGNPYDQIMKEMQDNKIDLIVMGSHSKKGITAHLLGSIADKVSHSARCPVLLVRE